MIFFLSLFVFFQGWIFESKRYTEDAGCAITAGIPVKFGTAHGRLRPEVGSAKCIGVCGKKGVPRVSPIFDTSDQKSTPPTVFLRTKQTFFSLTVCRLVQYLPNGREKTGFLS